MALAIAGFSGSGSKAAEEPSQKANSDTIRLSNNDKYKAAFDNLLDSPLAWSSTKSEIIAYLWKRSSAASAMRDYAKAEDYARQIIKLEPESHWIHDPLSVYLGKQGKYEEAIAEAQKAIRLDSAAVAHANLVLASWEWLSGKKDEALKRVESAVLPEKKSDQRSYYAALIYFHAAAGDEEKIEAAITKASALDEDGTLADFLARDDVFKPYREKDWFTKLMLKTFLESKPKEDVPERRGRRPIQYWFYLGP